jgi:hypothetical protein
VGTRVVAFAGRAVSVDYRGRAAWQLVNFLFRDLPPTKAARPHVRLSVLPGGKPDSFEFRRNDETLSQDCTPGAAADLLISEAIYHLADRATGGMVMHAAAVASPRGAMLLPGKSGAGKSTLTAWLLRRGYHYLTDELAYIPAGTRKLHALTRPVHIKHPALPVVSDFAPILKSDRVRVVTSPQATLIPHRLLNRRHVSNTARIERIVFPAFRPGADFALTRLSPAQAGMAFMECLINARNLSGHGFPEASRVARIVPAWRLTYGAIEQLDERLLALIP